MQWNELKVLCDVGVRCCYGSDVSVTFGIADQASIIADTSPTINCIEAAYLLPVFTFDTYLHIYLPSGVRVSFSLFEMQLTSNTQVASACALTNTCCSVL